MKPLFHFPFIQKKLRSTILPLVFCLGAVQAQNIQKGIHQEQAEQFKAVGKTSDEWRISNINNSALTPKALGNCPLNKLVFGWHPYWSNGLESNYEWSLLSDLSYFSYEVNASTGNANSTNGWATANVIDEALANGVRVNLCVTLFSGHATFFDNPTAQQTLISNLISMIQSRGGNGVNIDFEGVPSAQSNALTNFMIDLSSQMHTAIPGSQVSIAIPAVDWGGVFNVAAMQGHVDLFIIMGYDYYWSGSSQAGPTDPLYTFQNTYDYNHSKSITHYLNQGVPKEKVLLGLPYYGREWETVGVSTPSATTGNFSTTRFYNYVRQNANGNYTSSQYELSSTSNYYVYLSGGNWRQCFVNSDFTLGKRYDMVNLRQLGGIGIWALGYDDGYSELWNKIEEKFTSCALEACSDTLYDLGGPNHDYYNNESFTYTISPSGASSISVNFSSFHLENGFDTLWIHDGGSINSPLIGSYTGSNGPGIINSSGGSLTFRYKSDVDITAAGWQAIYQCNQDLTQPTVQVNTNNWETESFYALYTENDNGTGVNNDERFSQILDFDGTRWSGNSNLGYLFDGFNPGLSIWTTQVGTWSTAGGTVIQTDETIGNTNLHIPITQVAQTNYLYSFKIKISGSGTNRRAGMHFMSSDATLTNRGNGYFVYLRADNDRVQIYKVTNDVWELETDDDLNVDVDAWYDVKVLFNQLSGDIRVYVDGNAVSSWTDSSPIPTGNSISLRTGNCTTEYDDVRVYQSRIGAQYINVGTPNDPVRYENPDPNTPACEIRTYIFDNAGNCSDEDVIQVNIDWSPPILSGVNDGQGADIDETNDGTQLYANWGVASDPNSGIDHYLVAIDTVEGGTSIYPFANEGLITSINVPYTLEANDWYYTTVKAVNTAGLESEPDTSDGQQYIPITVGIEEYLRHSIYPNPTTGIIHLPQIDNLNWELMDVTGRVVSKGSGEIQIDIRVLGLPEQTYTLRLITEEIQTSIKLMYLKH